VCSPSKERLRGQGGIRPLLSDGDIESGRTYFVWCGAKACSIDKGRREGRRNSGSARLKRNPG